MLTLDHVVFPVRDPDATLRFYTEIVGLPLIEAHSGDDWDGFPWLMMIFGVGGRQELVAVALRGAPAPDYRGVPVDARHYAFAADSEAEIDGWRARLAAAGVDFWEERHGEQRSVYFPDPDGIILEVTWPKTWVSDQSRPEAMETARRWIRAKQPA
jgi:catechol 2,3-dioxygenase-like lactoylglutathione lyase family enzyme